MHPSRLQIPLIALYLLDGAVRSVDTEDVAYETNRLAPGKFSWRKYPDQINMELIRTFLSDLKKTKNGALVSGTGRSGWSLTVAGVTWINANKLLISELKTGKTTAQSPMRSGSVDSMRQDREESRLKNSNAWISWIDQNSALIVDIEALFRVDSYTDEKQLNRKINRFKTLFTDNPEIIPFIDEMAARLLERKKQHQRTS